MWEPTRSPGPWEPFSSLSRLPLGPAPRASHCQVLTYNSTLKTTSSWKLAASQPPPGHITLIIIVFPGLEHPRS